MTENKTSPDWPRLVPLAILAASAGALGIAYTAQYAFAIEPCRLCLYQRAPYVVNGLLAILALGLPAVGRARSWAVALCAALFLAGAAIAFHHVGVEQHWWASAASCGDGLGEVAEMTLAEMKARLLAPAEKPCDEVDWTLFGLSMATYNVAVSLALAAGAGAGALKLARMPSPSGQDRTL